MRSPVVAAVNFLVGQPVPPRDRDRVRSLVFGYAGVTAVRELLVTYVGLDRVWVLARIDILDDLRSSEVTSLVGDIEAGLERESKYIYRVDIVSVGTGRGG
jgi:divalent metal cation (Fe/Co/Zn/Cd) transporter